MEDQNFDGELNKNLELLNKIRKIKKWLSWSTIIVGLISVAIAFIVLFTFIAIVGGASQDNNSGDNINNGPVTNLNLPAKVESYRSIVVKECNDQGCPDLVPYVLAIMAVETRGEGSDVMQSSESQGHAPGYFSPPESIHYGVMALHNSQKTAQAHGIDMSGVLLGYNFGSGYLEWLAKQGLTHSSTKTADVYSKTVVAPALGNTTGATYSYPNPVAIPYNGGFLYLNGGNFFYDLLVGQYLKQGGGASPSGNKILDEAQKYLGIPYVWGGHNPATGLDCSGFVGLVLTNVTGKPYPMYTVSLESCGTEVPLNQIQAGDMLFWGAKGASHHVAFYMGDGKVIEEPQPGDVCHIRTYHDGNEPNFAVRPNL
ncbi:lysozyme family protein [Latilactobacillus fragifolii]|uniref:lysozyme family protein n=1 Tax=Latilactobacillus fragifolii TaxID=2814244 RepID=UPI001F34640B|nr:lysozyme family protein [Latilactobacillus fragifolii]